ncbi:MAG: hypothetical protein N2235_10795 [Fischerella sp.]|nr:hypothetical protein [Fischerella sp.]
MARLYTLKFSLTTLIKLYWANENRVENLILLKHPLADLLIDKQQSSTTNLFKQYHNWAIAFFGHPLQFLQIHDIDSKKGKVFSTLHCRRESAILELH